jgi:hypothetical protein
MTDASGYAQLDDFRRRVYGQCLVRRRDVLFEVSDALLCAPGPVTDLARLSLPDVFTRGHGALYDGVNNGGVDADMLRQVLAEQPLARFGVPGDRQQIVLGVDASNWLRPDAATALERLFCHVYARGRGKAQMIPGWPFLFVAALSPGASSWAQVVDAQRLGPDDDLTTITFRRVHAVVKRLVKCGAWQAGDPNVLVVLDAGFEVCRLAWLLKGEPVTLVARVRSDRVFYAPAPPAHGRGRPGKHGPALKCADPATWPVPEHTTTNDTTRYGTARAVAFEAMHPKVSRQGGWADHEGELPVIEGTVIRLEVDRLPGDRNPQPVWLWCSEPGGTDWDVDHWWSAYLRRFDIEHMFRFFKQHLGWARPMLRDPASAERWTWVVIIAYTQLHLARPLAADYRLAWQRPLPPDKLTPGRIRADFPRIHAKAAHLARGPKITRPGTGRKPGSTNRTKAPVQPVGKTRKS